MAGHSISTRATHIHTYFCPSWSLSLFYFLSFYSLRIVGYHHSTASHRSKRRDHPTSSWADSLFLYLPTTVARLSLVHHPRWRPQAEPPEISADHVVGAVPHLPWVIVSPVVQEVCLSENQPAAYRNLCDGALRDRQDGTSCSKELHAFQFPWCTFVFSLLIVAAVVVVKGKLRSCFRVLSYYILAGLVLL